jgi:hypothetical protein
MSEVTFTTVQRPTKTAGGFPVKLAAAIEATLTSGMAVRVDTSRMSVRKANGLYRLAFAHGKTTPFVLQRRRTKTELYFWAEARRAQ